ncbi:MAG: Rad52/22 double-strand break repair protein [Gemmatimonadetes bacterium]|nr:Rad52/22 double-strand break repair protein [Gemmatimonadota bacterium]
MSGINWQAVAALFPPADLEWRLQQSGEKNGRVWAMAVPYITARAIMQRLDDVVGPGAWKNKFQPGPGGGVVCGISVRVGDEWVTKWDGAENTDFEGVKGGLSGAMKRAAVQWGIGRYLYGLEDAFARVHEEGRLRGKTKEGKAFKWDPPVLPAWAVPAATPAPAPAPRAAARREPASDWSKAPEPHHPQLLGFIAAHAADVPDNFNFRLGTQAYKLGAYIADPAHAGNIEASASLARHVALATEKACGVSFDPTGSYPLGDS